MIFDPAFIQACAPTVTVSTVQAIVDRESHGNPFAVNVNRSGGDVLSETKTHDAARNIGETTDPVTRQRRDT